MLAFAPIFCKLSKQNKSGAQISTVGFEFGLLCFGCVCVLDRGGDDIFRSWSSQIGFEGLGGSRGAFKVDGGRAVVVLKVYPFSGYF